MNYLYIALRPANRFWLCLPLIAILLCSTCLATVPADSMWQPPDPAESGSAGCVLHAEVPQVDDGYSETLVRLELGVTAFHVFTDSNLDTTLGPLGLTVDGGDFIAADRVESGTNLVFENALNDIVRKFKRGSVARLILRFWPTWPQTGEKTVEISLKGFTRAYSALSTCG